MGRQTLLLARVLIKSSFGFQTSSMNGQVGDVALVLSDLDNADRKLWSAATTALALSPPKFHR
jgi:hypothetical protein